MTNKRSSTPTKLPGIPKPPVDISVGLRRYLENLSEAVEIRLGRRGDQRDRAVTLRELINSGLAVDLYGRPFDPNLSGSDFTNAIPDIDVEIDTTVPPAPTSFSVEGGYSLMVLAFDYPSYSNHALTEVWRHDADVIGDAQLIGITSGPVYIDPCGEDVSFYYWVRHVSDAGIIGPYNSVDGTLGETATNVETLLTELEGNIPAVAFADGIEPIGVVDALPNPVGYDGPVLVFLTTDGKLYRYVSGAWTKAVAVADFDSLVDTVQLANDAVTNAKIAVNAIQGDVIAASAITADKILDGVVGSLKLADEAVTNAKIAVDAIQGDVIAAGAITETKISDDAVSTNKLSANAVTAAKIAANTITASEIAANTITASEIAANTITASEIVANTITAAEIAAATITAAEIAVNTITAALIQAGAITSTEIAANTITASNIAADTITSAEIAANAITASEIAASAVTAIKIAADAVTASKIAAGAITAGAIAAGAVNATNIISDGIIIGSKIAANAITAAKIAAGTITGDKISAATITGAKIASNTITTTNLAANSVTATQLAISANTDGASSSIYMNSSGAIKVYDSSGTLRVKLGNLSA